MVGGKQKVNLDFKRLPKSATATQWECCSDFQKLHLRFQLRKTCRKIFRKNIPHWIVLNGFSVWSKNFRAQRWVKVWSSRASKEFRGILIHSLNFSVWNFSEIAELQLHIRKFQLESAECALWERWRMVTDWPDLFKSNIVKWNLCVLVNGTFELEADIH